MGVVDLTRVFLGAETATAAAALLSNLKKAINSTKLLALALSSSAFSHDIYKGLIKKNASAKEILK